MLYKIKPFTEISESDWDEFVNSCDSGWLWHTGSFIKALAFWRNHINVSFAIVDSFNKIVAIFPLFIIKSKVCRVFNTATLSNIGGWLINSKDKEKDDVEKILLVECKNIAKLNSCHEININYSSASLYHKQDPLFLSGEKGEVAYISVLDLRKTEDELWSQMRKGLRYEIKRAEKLNITFREAVSTDFGEYYKMHLAVCDKSSIQAHTQEYFKKIFREILSNKQSYIGCALQNNKVLSMVNYGVYNNIAVYWTGACYKEAYDTGANHFLHWVMLKNLKNKGVNFLDMGEVFIKHSSSKIQGISDFKTSFGGELQRCYKANIKLGNKILAIYKTIRGIGS